MSLSRAQRQRIDRIARGRSHEPLFLLEGVRAVRDALGTGAVAEVWMREDLALEDEGGVMAAARAARVPVGLGAAADFERLGRTVSPQGVLALVRDTAQPLAAVAARSGLLLWLDGVQDPGNVGAVMRVAVAFGAAGLLVSAGGAHPLAHKALRASAGLGLRVPFACAPAADVAAALAAREVYVLARDGEDVLGLTAVPRDLALVVGSEGRGPGPEACGAATRTLGIPIDPQVDSLNAAVAAGIAVCVLRRLQAGSA